MSRVKNKEVTCVLVVASVVRSICKVQSRRPREDHPQTISPRTLACQVIVGRFWQQFLHSCCSCSAQPSLLKIKIKDNKKGT